MWLFEHEPVKRGTYSVSEAIKDALRVGNVQLARAFTPRGRHVTDFATDMLRDEVIRGCGYQRPKGARVTWLLDGLAKAGRLDIVFQVVELHYSAPPGRRWFEEEWKRVAREVCARGDMPLMRWMVNVQMASGWYTVQTEDYSFEWLRESVDGGKKLMTELLVIAAEEGSVATMQYLHDHGRVDSYRAALLGGERKNKLRSVQWMFTHFPDDEQASFYHIMGEAAAQGHLGMVEYLHKEDLRPTSWLRKKDMLKSQDGPFSCSSSEAERHHYGYMHDLRAVLPTEAMDRAATNGQLDVVIWLDAVRPEACSKEAMDGAASNGHLEVVSWLHRVRSEGCTTAAMDGAARNGHLEVVQWLHTNRREGCTVRAMDGAAGNGHLEVVQWLHGNRSEGCTTNAMDSAAKHGHLEVIKWLHAHRSEGCTSQAIDNALHGRTVDCSDQIPLHVVEWLHQHFPQYTPEEERFWHGYWDFGAFLFLFGHYPNMFTPGFIQSCWSHDDEVMCTQPPHVIAWLSGHGAQSQGTILRVQATN